MFLFMCVYMQESVEHMGLYEDISGASGAPVQVIVVRVRIRVQHQVKKLSM